MKHVWVAILILNGLNMTFRILPTMEKFSPKGGQPTAEFLKAKKQAKIAGMIGLAFWYLITIFAVIM